MCEKDFYENDSFIGGQGHFAPDYEKSQGDQDRQIEKISEVGPHTCPKASTGGESASAGEFAMKSYWRRIYKIRRALRHQGYALVKIRYWSIEPHLAPPCFCDWRRCHQCERERASKESAGATRPRTAQPSKSPKKLRKG